MSREQWGHGFHTGVKAAEYMVKSQIPKYIVEYRDGYCNAVSIVHEKHGDVFVLEDISFIDMLRFRFGEEPSTAKEDIIPDNIRELNISELENPKFFFSWNTVTDEFNKAINR